MSIGPTPVQTAKTYSGSGTSGTATCGAGVSLGNLLVARVMVGAGGSLTFTTPTNWTDGPQAITSSSGGISTAIFYCLVDGTNILAGTTTFSFAWSSSHSFGIYLEEWPCTEGWQSSPLDVSAPATHPTASTSLDTGATASTAQDEELWIAALAYKAGNQTIDSLTSGWTFSNDSNGTANSQVSLSQIVSSIGTAEVTGTLHSTAEINAGVVATFMPIAFIALTIIDSATGSEVNTGATTFIATDAASGADSQATGTLLTDSASGADSQSTGTLFADAASGSDTFSLATVAIPMADSATGGAESITFATIAAAVTDGASGAESVSGAVTLAAADTSSGSDSVTTLATMPIVDAAAGGSETISFAPIALTVSDTATGSASVTGATTFTTADSGAGSDSVSALLIAFTIGDSATGAETPSAFVTGTVADSASGADSESAIVSFSVAEANTVQTLTTYLTNIASATLSTAGKVIATGGGASVGVDTTLGTATGIGEVYPLGTAQAWASLSSLPALPSGHGAILDGALLDNAQFQAGNWQPTLRGTLHNGTANITADLTLRVWILLANGGYSGPIATNTLTGQTIAFATSNTYVLPAVNVSSFGLGVGDRIYYEILPNITANPNTATNATLRFNFSNSSSTGANNSQVTTPSYVTGHLTESIANNLQFSLADAGSGGTLIAFAARPPVSTAYNLPNVPTGGPYVSSSGGLFQVGATPLRRLYGSTFYPATEGGSPLWQTSDGSFNRWIDGIIATYVANRLTVLRPTDQWGSDPSLTWDNPIIWANMDYLVQQAAQAGLWVQMDLSGYKSVLTAAGMYAFTASFWTDFLTAVGSHYRSVNNILFYTIAGEPTFPHTQADVNALTSFFTSTIATLKAADPNHLISPGGFINMNNGLANWWQQIWALAGVDVCCYKTYSQNDLNNQASYSSYAVTTLGKIAVEQEFGVQGYVGDGVATGQTVNGYTGSRANYYDTIYKTGEATGTAAFIFWNYDHLGDSANWAADVPTLADAAIGQDAVTVNGNVGLSIQDTAHGSDLLTALTASYDNDPVAFPVTWGIVQQHAASQPVYTDSAVGSEVVSVFVVCAVADSAVGSEASLAFATIAIALTDAGNARDVASVLIVITVADSAHGTQTLATLITWLPPTHPGGPSAIGSDPSGTSTLTATPAGASVLSGAPKSTETIG
jgi:hypothetical protein